MVSRRQFVAGAAAASALRAAAYAPKLMLQPYVWTQWLQKQNVPLAAGLEQMFRESHQAGYRRMELIDSMVVPELRARTATLARQQGFELPVVYHGGTFHEAGAAERSIQSILETAGAARAMGAAWVNTNANPKPRRERKTDAELAAEADNLNRLGRALRDRGMRLMLHAHDPDMAEGAREWRSNLRLTDPALVWICADVHWMFRGGQDPMELLRLAGPRIASLHVRNSTHGIWSESFGPGDVDYSAVARFLRQIGYQGLIGVELAYENGTNPQRPLEEDLKISRQNAEAVFGLG